MGNPFQNVFNAVVELYIWCLIIWVILSWLVAFNVVNTRNRFVAVVGDFLDEKGKSRQLICRGPQREFLTFIKKSDNPIELYRGELITLD